MKRGNRYRIYPDEEQKALMEKHFGSTRFVYNKLLNIKFHLYKKFRISISEFELNNHLLVLKEVYPWLKKLIQEHFSKPVEISMLPLIIFLKMGLDILKEKAKRIIIFLFNFHKIIALT